VELEDRVAFGRIGFRKSELREALLVRLGPIPPSAHNQIHDAYHYDQKTQYSHQVWLHGIFSFHIELPSTCSAVPLV
jgi:hypothetical protein